jgi:hypothetical protein
MRRSSAAQLALPIEQDVSLATTPCTLSGHVGVMCYAEGRDAFRALFRDAANRQDAPRELKWRRASIDVVWSP